MSADERPPAAVGPPGTTSAGADASGAGYGSGSSLRPRGSLTLVRIVVAVLAVIVLVESATHLVPAIRAGMHEGARGYWVVTGRKCTRKACVWIGKFELPSGHVRATGLQYSGSTPVGIHAGSRIAALYPGGGLAFPVTGSDLWISLLVAILVALLGLYWAAHRWVAGYLRQRADTARLAAPQP